MARLETVTVPARSTTRIGRDETIPRWSHSARMTLGALTLGSTALFAITAVAVAVMMILAPDVARPRMYEPLHFVLLFATFADYLLTLFYVWFVSQNPRVESRALWIAAMIVVPWIAQPMYWYAHVLCAPYVGDRDRDHPVPGRTARAPA